MVLLALATGPTIATPAGAQTGACSPESGVTVVVDYASLGGDVAVGCAAAPGTGFEALTQAGFQFTQAQSNPGFVCRIDGLPGVEAEDCVDIPPATAFWSYWTAELGGTWTSSSLGASGAVAGDLQGWAFSTGKTSPPRFAVPPAPTTTTTTTTTATPTTTTSVSVTTTTASTTTTVAPSTSTTASSSTSTTTTSTTTSTTSTSTTVPPPTTASTVESTTTTSMPTTAGTERNGPMGVILGTVAIAGLAGGGLVLARRRSRGPS